MLKCLLINNMGNKTWENKIVANPKSNLDTQKPDFSRNYLGTEDPFSKW